MSESGATQAGPSTRHTRGRRGGGSYPRTSNYPLYDGDPIFLEASTTCRSSLFLAHSLDVGERGLFTSQPIPAGGFIGTYGDVFVLPGFDKSEANVPEDSDLRRYAFETGKKPDYKYPNCFAIPLAQVAGVPMPPPGHLSVMQFANSLPLKAGEEGGTNNMYRRMIPSGFYAAKAKDCAEKDRAPLYVIAMFAARDIFPDEELFWYYGDESGQDATCTQLKLQPQWETDEWMTDSLILTLAEKIYAMVAERWQSAKDMEEDRLTWLQEREVAMQIQMQGFSKYTLCKTMGEVADRIRFKSGNTLTLKHLHSGSLDCPKDFWPATVHPCEPLPPPQKSRKPSSAIASWRAAQKEFLRQRALEASSGSTL